MYQSPLASSVLCSSEPGVDIKGKNSDRDYVGELSQTTQHAHLYTGYSCESFSFLQFQHLLHLQNIPVITSFWGFLADTKSIWCGWVKIAQISEQFCFLCKVLVRMAPFETCRKQSQWYSKKKHKTKQNKKKTQVFSKSCDRKMSAMLEM